MIHVGASGGVLDFVPMSSSTKKATRSQLAALADTWPSIKRLMMKQPVLAYQAPSLLYRSGRKAGQVHLTAPSL